MCPMRSSLSSFLVLLFATSCVTCSDMFEDWAARHKVSYQLGTLEMEIRRSIWEDNVKYIEEYNRKHTGVTLQMNHFGDLTNEEFRAMKKKVTPSQPGENVKEYKPPADVEAPVSKDWRDDKVVGPVRNQGDCGSCYAYSAVTAVESMLAITTGKFQALSVQQVVDCSGNWGNDGCDGGTPENVFRYLRDTAGLELETDYPDRQQQGACSADFDLSVAHVDSFVKIKKYNEKELKSAVGLFGPVSVGIDAGERSMQFYRSGIYSDPMCITARIDHAVVVVGYGSEKGKDYWIVRNSWGSNWGMEGYLRLARNRQNMCGVASQAIFPVVSKKY